jgi:phage-related holin
MRGVELSEYLEKAFESVQPILVFIWSLLLYVLFPEATYVPAFCTVVVSMVIDVLTKYYSLSKLSGSFVKALKKHVINSNSMWVGTSKKIIDYMLIFIMVGLSYRVTPIAGVVVFLGTVAYGFVFFREWQSIFENLEDAGHDVSWWLQIIKKRKKKILEDEGVNENDEP